MSKDDVAELKQFDELEKDRQQRLQHEKEMKDSQSYIDAQAAKCVEEFPDMVSSPERNKKLEEQKKKREKERWREFHFFKD